MAFTTNPYALLKKMWVMTSPSRGREFKANDDTPQDVKDEINAIYNKVGLGEKKL